jgi:hypothetical protein
MGPASINCTLFVFTKARYRPCLKRLYKQKIASTNSRKRSGLHAPNRPQSHGYSATCTVYLYTAALSRQQENGHATHQINTAAYRPYSWLGSKPIDMMCYMYLLHRSPPPAYVRQKISIKHPSRCIRNPNSLNPHTYM